jgi:hypothetical protein
MKPPSKRFNPSVWSERLIPLVLILLALGLVATIAVVILSILGLTPGL